MFGLFQTLLHLRLIPNNIVTHPVWVYSSLSATVLVFSQWINCLQWSVTLPKIGLDKDCRKNGQVLLLNVYICCIALQLWRRGWKDVLLVIDTITMVTTTVAELSMLDVVRHMWNGLKLSSKNWQWSSGEKRSQQHSLVVGCGVHPYSVIWK